MNASRVLVLQHQDDDGPGNLGAWLDANGIPWDVVDVTAGLPAAGRYGALAVLGSKESAFDDTVSWIPAERAFVGACVDVGTPVFGICFGAQLLSLVLGGAVRRLQLPEYGWTEVGGSAPAAGTWFMWHQDGIDLPPGATVLAAGDTCLHAYAVGQHLGVQYHPEVGVEQIEQWLEVERRTDALERQGISPEAVIAESREKAPAAETQTHDLYAAFFAPLDLAAPDHEPPTSQLTS